MKFYYVYILKSLTSDLLNIGFTQDLKKQVLEQNNKEELIHYEAFRSINDAKRRSEYLNSAKGKASILILLKDYFSNDMPKGSIICPLCEGQKEVPTKSFFVYGDRRSGLNALCLTCKGKGWVLPGELKEMGSME